MRFWFREVAGWLLILLGLYLFFDVYNLLQENKYFQSGPWVLIGIFVFRGGIQLLRVAVAARICMKAQEQAVTKPAPVRTRPQRPVGRPEAVVRR